MKMREDQERLRGLLTDTITMLCKNSVIYKQQFCVEALIGITLDQEDVLLVNIKEIVEAANAPTSVDELNVDLLSEKKVIRKRKRHRNRGKKNKSDICSDSSADDRSSGEEEPLFKSHKPNSPTELTKQKDGNEETEYFKVKDDEVEIKEEKIEDNDDVMFVKAEPKSPPQCADGLSSGLTFPEAPFSSTTSARLPHDTSVHLNINDVFQQSHLPNFNEQSFLSDQNSSNQYSLQMAPLAQTVSGTNGSNTLRCNTKLVCDLCLKEFTKPSSLSRHRATIHTSCKTYYCDHCNKTFNRRDNLIAHLKLQHKIFPNNV